MRSTNPEAYYLRMVDTSKPMPMLIPGEDGNQRGIVHILPVNAAEALFYSRVEWAILTLASAWDKGPRIESKLQEAGSIGLEGS